MEINARIDNPHYQKLEYLIQTTENNISEVITQAIDFYYEQAKQTQKNPSHILLPSGFKSIVHEIKQNAQLIADNAVRLKELVNHHFSPNENQKHQLDLLFYDLETYTNDLLENIKLFSDPDILKQEENPVILKAKNIIKNQQPQPLNFREQFQIEARSYWQNQKIKVFEFDYEGRQKFQEPYLQMHSANFRLILRNLLHNAVKYACPNTAITAKLIYTHYGLKFTLTNKAPCLKEGEEFRLFDFGFRGHHAKENQVDGKGIGLFLVQEICRLYQIGIRYVSEPDDVLCLHTFILFFPLKLVTGDKTHEIA